MPSKKTTKKNIVVNRKFLNRLADRIYTNSKSFLRLCDGALQGDTDPTNDRRPMHCGLGELYFAMTGLEPEQTGVREGDIIDLAFNLSPLAKAESALDKEMTALEKQTKAGIKKLNIPEDIKTSLLNAADSTLVDVRYDRESEIEAAAEQFRTVLNDIPDANDDGCGDGESCSLKTYRERSKRVAEKIREAAELLPA